MVDEQWGEELFRAAWKRIAHIWDCPRLRGAAVRGCGRDTFAGWANMRPGPQHDGTYWRRVMLEAVRRGWVVKGTSEYGYTTFRKIK